MTTQDTEAAPKSRLLASQEQLSLRNYLRSFVSRMRSGDLGPLTIVIGLVIIAVIFQSQNSNFLTARNFVNLIPQMAGTTLIAFGVVFVLLLGEIDLSVGYVSAVGGVGMTLMLRPPTTTPWFVAIGAAVVITALIGGLHGTII